MSSVYLERYAYPKSDFSTLAYGQPDLIVVLPCHNEPDLIIALESLEACEAPEAEVCIIVMINASETSHPDVKDRNIQTWNQAKSWLESDTKKYSYHFLLDNELPGKHAGVGLARKIGMDEAVRVFEAQQKDGIILCFDADSICDPNLFIEVEKLFTTNPKCPGCSIHFEHPIKGGFPDEIYTGILNYELHLRYHVDGLKYAGFPYAFQTIGSSMAVRSSAYQKQGGMNRRKAGEDFYFLHKIIPLGHFMNLKTTKIIPSPRRSDRVPFGTGRAIGHWLDEGKFELTSYNPQIYKDLNQFLDYSNNLYQNQSVKMTWQGFPSTIQGFVPWPEFENQVAEFNAQANSLPTFRKRFFQWFDGFKALKYVHFARDEFYPNVPIAEGVDWLFETMGIESTRWDLKTKLEQLRKVDLKG